MNFVTITELVQKLDRKILLGQLQIIHVIVLLYRTISIKLEHQQITFHNHKIVIEISSKLPLEKQNKNL